MTTFLALFRGPSILDAQMVAVSTDPLLTAYVADEILSEPPDYDSDPIAGPLNRGRREALSNIVGRPYEPPNTPEARA